MAINVLEESVQHALDIEGKGKSKQQLRPRLETRLESNNSRKVLMVNIKFESGSEYDYMGRIYAQNEPHVENSMPITALLGELGEVCTPIYHQGIHDFELGVDQKIDAALVSMGLENPSYRTLKADGTVKYTVNLRFMEDLQKAINAADSLIRAPQ